MRDADLAAGRRPPSDTGETSPRRVPVLPRLVRYVWAVPNTLLGALLLPCAWLPDGRVRVVDGVVEAHAPLLSWVLRHCVLIPGGAAAITFGHIVLGRDARSLHETRAHERVHVRQYEIWGPAFIPAYLIASLWAALTGAGAYTGNWFERAAALEDRPGRRTEAARVRYDQGIES
jgi:hypothetical protein